jgi:hypothetical protein
MGKNGGNIEEFDSESLTIVIRAVPILLIGMFPFVTFIVVYG